MPTHVISANGTEADPTTGDVQIPIYKRKVILTDAQIKALPTTPVVLIEAPGAGKALLVLGGKMIAKSPATVAYSNRGTSGGGITQFYFDLEHGLATPPADGSFNLLQGNPLFSVDISKKSAFYKAGDAEIDNGYTSADDLKPISGILTNENLALTLYMDNYDSGGSPLGNFTGGNATNTFELTVFYSIVDL